MQNILKNWKTTLAGAVIIGEAALHTFAGVNIPGFSMDLSTALTVGIGLIVAGDSQPSA
jgi:multidrug efflux pump subunit AcrB